MNAIFRAEGTDHWLLKRQQPIMTTNVSRTQMFLRLVVDPRRTTPTMGVIIGVAGIGKTIAAHVCCEEFATHASTALPLAIKVSVESRSSPRALALLILEGLGERPLRSGSNVYEITKEVVKAIKRNAIRLLIIDEADRLNEDSFDVVRDIFDRTGCPIVLVGLPSIIDVIERYDKFRSRARLRLRFVPLGEEEIVTTVLPQLTAIPRWVYNVTNPDDCQMGRELWQRVNPSLRDLVSVLDTASQIAETHALPKILPVTIQEAFPWAGLDPDMAVSSAFLPKASPPQTDEDKGEKEQESADRAEGKRRRHAH